jgi:hypothetical protein
MREFVCGLKADRLGTGSLHTTHTCTPVDFATTGERSLSGSMIKNRQLRPREANNDKVSGVQS